MPLPDFRNNKELLRAVKFGLVGVMNTAVDFAVFWLVGRLFPSASVYLAQTCGYAAGTLNSYAINRKWTFDAKSGFFSAAVVKFVVLNLCMLALSWGIIWLMMNSFALAKFPAKIIATCVTMVVSFVINKFWVFK